MAIPMRQVSATTSMFKEMNDKNTVIDMIKSFTRDFVSSQEATAVRKFITNASADISAEDLASNAQSVLTSITSYCLFATHKSERLTVLLNKKALLESSVFNYVCSSMYKASTQLDLPAAVLFKVKHLGIFVAYNGSMSRNEGAYIVVPATERGFEEIKIMSLEQFKNNMKESFQ